CIRKAAPRPRIVSAEIGQLEQAIETLERGRGLLWSEMRGLRSSIDHLVQSICLWRRNLQLSIGTRGI
ncbi:hypothetical protein BJV74DRAFT_855532, partial [Russula compacta]